MLIKNKKNRKILYSKSIAALNAKGKYIVQLDQDDIFIRDDVFDILYNEAEKSNLDLVQIRDIFNENLYLSRHTRVNYPAKHFIKREVYNKSYPETQPGLKNEMFKKGNIYLLWGLLIKTDIYKKSIYHLWPLIINYQLIYYEDYVITSIIVIYSSKFRYINKFALIHLNHNNSAMNQYYDQFYISVLICENIIYNYYIRDNPRDIKIAINYLDRYKDVYKLTFKLYLEYFFYNIINILKNVYITNKDRQFILNELEINYKQFKMWNSYKVYMNYYQFISIFNFQNLCSQDLIKIIKNYKKPKISVIVYCLKSKYLKKTINSIQNQENIEFEIIVIFDNILNHSLDLIRENLSQYENIKFFCNNKTKGNLYSYSFGVLKAEGEYVLILKSGETLARNKVLNELSYKIHQKKGYDILEFNLLINNKDDIQENSFLLYRCEHIKSQINFDSFKYNKQSKGLDQEKELITNKLIKTSIFKKIIYKYKLNEYKNIFIYYDKILLFLFSKEGAKLMHTELFGIIKYINIIKLLYLNDNLNKDYKYKKESIFYINFLFENTNNTFKEKKIALYEFYNVLSLIYNKFNTINNTSKILYNKILNSEFISTFEKDDLKFYYKSLIN